MNFKCERFGSCIYARGRYQHPTRPSQGTTAFNQVCKYDFNLFYFSFYVFMLFLYFFLSCFKLIFFCSVWQFNLVWCVRFISCWHLATLATLICVQLNSKSYLVNEMIIALIYIYYFNHITSPCGISSSHPFESPVQLDQRSYFI